MNKTKNSFRPRRFGCLRQLLIVFVSLLLICSLWLLAYDQFYSAPFQRLIDSIRQWTNTAVPVMKESDMLAFTCYGDSWRNKQLYSMRPDGSQLRKIFETTTQYVNDITWSADGTWIAFEIETIYELRHFFGGDYDSEILRIRFDGSVFRRVTYNDLYDSMPQWLPDGNSILSRYHGGILQTASSGYLIKKLDPLHIWSYGLSPDGDTLAVAANDPVRRYHEAIFRININDNAMILLTDVKHGYNRIKWSLDQRHLMLFADHDWKYKPRHLRIIDAHTGSGKVSIPLDATDAEWSPDSRWVAIVGSRGEDSANDLLLLNIETGAIQEIIFDVGYSTAWSPDGEWIAFSLRSRNDYLQLHKVRRDGTGLQTLTHLDCDVVEIAWSPV
ncbi:MAG: hypothetical protein OXG60_12895 [Chloroflexi bacterium]|nr:hypothetical protein [Chloroflexota bacterium]